MRSLTSRVLCVCTVFLCGWLAGIASGQDAEQVPPPPSQYKSSDIEYEHFFNHGNVKKIKDPSGAGGSGKLENEVIKSKVEVLGEVLKRRVQALRNVPGQKVELVFLVDSSASVGAENFFNELKFVKKLLADFTVSTDAARVAVVTFSSKNRVVRHIDHLTFATADKHKCRLLDQELPAIGYNSGGTYTLGALLEAQAVLGYARPDAVMAIFLVTDGYSNGGDPRPAAKRLREQGVEIFTFGIRNGNVKELFDMASEPQQEHSYIVDSFEEFEALARRALHEDLQTGSYLPQNMTACDRLCKNQTDCCHSQAQCTCGTHTGHYACVCPPGHYGTGLKGDCHPCPGGTYRSEGGPGDLRSCKPCPDENHISEPGSKSVEQCRCQRGYVAEGTTCQLLACPKLELPKNGYFVKNVCNSVFNGACGIRCNAGYKLVGSSIRLCQENGTWSGEETSCVMRSCGEIKAPKNGRMNCSQDDYVIDTECQFQCDSGYSLVGSRKRVCLPIGFWDGLPAFCKPVYCSPLPKLLNGTLTPTSCSLAKSRFGEECSAECQGGFELKGPSVRRCQDNGSWSEESNKSRCVDVTPPSITCPENMTLTALINENFANVSWEPPKSSDNSGHTPDIISLPAVTELPMKFRIGTSSITYVAQDRRGNKAECTFHVTVLDVEPPTVDQCESPPTFLLRDRSVNVTWDEPIFSDNSAKAVNVQRSHDPGVFPLGETQVVYTAWDDSGNNATCRIVVTVQEHACHMPVDPIHGQANCTQAPDAVFCSLTCYDGYAFALPPRQDYFCAYDGQWLPDANPMPFPDCSVTTHSNTVIQDGVLRLDAEPKFCDDPFLMSSMEGQFKRRLAARLNEICGDNMICQVDDLQAECRQVVAEETDVDWVSSNEIPRSKRSLTNSNETTSEQPLITIRPPKTRRLELRFKVRSRVPTGNITGPGLVETAAGINVTMKELLFAEMNAVRDSLAKSALKGDFDVQFGGRHMNVRGVKFISDRPQFFCDAGSVPHDEKCVLCPVGTYFNVVSETCESCTQGSYQPSEGQLSCLVCPGNTSTKVVNAKRPEECQAQCLAGTFSASGLEPCTTCPVGTYQSEYFRRECVACPEGSTTVRRGGRRIEDCRPLCQKGHVSETGLTPVCFPCPMGYYQPQSGQKFCIKCPKFMTTSTNGAASKADCRLPELLLDASGTGGDLLLNDAVGWTDEFEEQSILEVNECFSLPCHNGGRCQTLEFGFICKCLPGFSGMQCETNIDECASLPCFNGGTCTDEVNNYTCQCAEGFIGHQCETNIDECLSDPCQNGATCVDRVLGYTCVCPLGWNGSHCQTEVDECLSDPCQNGATCIDRLANFTCVCPEGWTGFLCEEAVDECLSEPCQNGGTCEDLIGSYYCHCPFGYDGINCQNDIDECAPSPCAHGATCIDKIGSFSCLCPPGVIGSTCNISVDSDFSLHFSSSGKLDYVVREGLREAELQRLTLCTWLNTMDRDNYGTPFSYATDGEANALTLTDYSGFVLYINGHKKVTDVTANDGRWHLVCITWDSTDGSWKIYADGEVRDQGIGLAIDSTISPNGTVILGQEQDSRGGDFSNAESYVGYLYGVELWNYVLDETVLTSMTSRCTGLKGNVLTWGDFKHGLRGGIRVEESTFCKGCSEPDPVDYGDISLSSTGEEQSIAYYTCHLGYELSIGSASRSCLVYGGWAGPEPQCRRVSCGFPGYILNGLVHGSSYSYGDTVTYNCTRGFKLVGNVSRSCDKTGVWTDEPPECQPMTCDPPVDFVDGTILEEQQTYAVGEKINFQCNSGFRLEGSVTLTCSDQGHWDDALPVCQPLACSYPPNVPNGVMTNGIAEIPPEDIPAYLTPGSILTYTCAHGFQLKSTASIICGHDGLWMGEIPRCEAVDCGPPVETPHSTIHRNRDDNGVGAVVRYVCHDGFEYFGPTELECTEKGRWLDRDQLATLPVCAPVDCGPVPSLENGEVLAEEMTFASVATVSCFKGFALIGPSNLTCTADRTWSHSDQIRCKPVTCTVEPQPIRNGRPASTLAAAYQYAQYVCDEGFRLSAVDSLQCQPDGTWQGEIPICLPMECPKPGNIEGGSWQYSGGEVSKETIFYTGAEIIYSCDEGLLMEGESRRVCDGSSGWMPRTPLPVCRKQHCPSLENPTRGSVIVEGFEPGQLASYECEQGYQVAGPSERLCTGQGIWSDEDPLCVEIVCEEPNAPSNGEAVFTSLSYGSKVLFQCNKGFTLEGAASKTCGDEGQWVGGKGRPVCVPRKCERPEIIEHGYISYDVSATGFVTGSSIVYDCEEGYEVIGIRERFCTALGDWTDEEPFCQLIHCDPVPSHLEHGTVIGNDTVYQSVIEFRCNPGYELLGAPQVTCESEKQWSAPFPVCRPRKCPHPGIVAHSTTTLKQLDSKHSSDVYHFGDVVTFSCLQGYSLSGPRERRCLQDGTWSQKIPTCNRITCPAAPIPTNGFTSRIIPNDLAASSGYGSNDENDERVVGTGRTVKFGCKPGFQLRGSTLARCMDSGQWDATPPTCYPIKCTPPPRVKYGTHNSTKKREFSVGDEVEYSCDFGFRLKGDPITSCTASGAWSAQPPSCQRAVCPTKYTLEDGTVTAVYPEDGGSRNVPMSLKFSCKPGYDLVGASIVHCTGSGDWNNPYPTCVPWPCSSPPVPEHGHIINTVVNSELISITVSCDPGYRLRENSVLTCGSNGQWNGKVECHPQLCPDPGAPPPYIKYVSQPSYRYGDQLHFSCPEGFVLNSTATFMTCGADGQWDGRFGFCTLVRCPILGHPEFGAVKYSGGTSFRSRATFSCDEGFSIQGPTEAVCLATGRWSVDPIDPECSALSCADPNPVQNAEMIVRGTKVGDTVRYECHQGFHLNGDDERSCLPNGKWSGDEAVCDPIYCPVPSHPEDGFWVVSGFSPGSTIRFQCLPGFTLIGAPVLTCLFNQEWDEEVPTCRQVTCPAPRNPDHGTVSIVNYTSESTDDSEVLSNAIQQQVSYSYRTEAHYQCDEGYQLFGPEMRTCTVDGTWSEQSPHCQRIWCPEPQPPTHGFVMGTGRQYGDRIRLSCMAGYRLLGLEESTCLSSGTWSEAYPQCEALTCDAPLHVAHSVAPDPSPGSWIIGTQVTLQCGAGYKVIGDLSLTCQPNQEWSPVKGKCHRIQCPRPAIKGASVVRIGDSATASFHLGDRVAISCSPGRRNRGGSAVLTCQPDGSWSGQPPVCESPACDGHCLNGGQCSSLPARRCSCPVGYSGDRCQHAHCILPCLYGGTCVAPYRCACRPGRGGPRCEKPICDPPCTNGGRCVSPNTCQCPHGTVGPTCRKRSDPVRG